jgi:hypothetical protein
MEEEGVQHGRRGGVRGRGAAMAWRGSSGHRGWSVTREAREWHARGRAGMGKMAHGPAVMATQMLE